VTAGTKVRKRAVWIALTTRPTGQRVSIQSANTTEDNTDTNTDEWPFELMPQVWVPSLCQTHSNRTEWNRHQLHVGDLRRNLFSRIPSRCFVSANLRRVRQSIVHSIGGRSPRRLIRRWATDCSLIFSLQCGTRAVYHCTWDKREESCCGADPCMFEVRALVTVSAPLCRIIILPLLMI
jgi:hypothetical protein